MLRKAKADGCRVPSVSVPPSWGWDGICGSTGGECGRSTVPGRATSSMPANRDRLGAAVSPASLLSPSCSQGQAGTMAPGCPGGSDATPGSSPGTVGAAGVRAGLRGVRKLSLARAGMSMSRSLAEPTEGAGGGRGALGEGWARHRASNCRSIWDGMGRARAASAKGPGSGTFSQAERLSPLTPPRAPREHHLSQVPAPGKGSQGHALGQSHSQELCVPTSCQTCARSPHPGDWAQGCPQSHLCCSVGHRPRAALAEVLQALPGHGKDLLRGEQVGAAEGRDGTHGPLWERGARLSQTGP